MKALQFNATVPRYVAGLGLRKLYPPGLWSGISCTYHTEVEVPELPSDDWVLIKTIYGGICGSDVAAIYLKASPYFQPFNSFPFTFGHENVGVIERVGTGVEGFQAGERVTAEPTLWCIPRGFSELCEYCRKGKINRCRRKTEGDVAPGLSIGFCKDTSGSWAPYFAAHKSQLYKIPSGISDENALMIEPFATGLHAALLSPPNDDETILIVGAGTIGLVTLAALRAIGAQAKIIVIGRYQFQGQAALKLGADEVILGRETDYFAALAERTNGTILQPLIGKRVLVGGADRTYDCVGSDISLDDSLRMTREGGKVFLVGVPGTPKGVDWTAPFLKELEIHGSHIYHHVEEFEGLKWKAFDLTIKWMAAGTLDLEWLVTHKFPPGAYDQALRLQGQRGQSGMIKTVFDFKTGAAA